jgi:hypothetical protein
MTDDHVDYYAWREEAGREMWADILDRIRRGVDPGKHTLAAAVSVFGVEPQSEVGRYVAARLSGKQTGKRGNPGYKRSALPPRAALREEYEPLHADIKRMKREDPEGYRQLDGDSPSMKAKRAIAAKYFVGWSTVHGRLHGK